MISRLLDPQIVKALNQLKFEEEVIKDKYLEKVYDGIYFSKSNHFFFFSV